MFYEFSGSQSMSESPSSYAGSDSGSTPLLDINKSLCCSYFSKSLKKVFSDKLVKELTEDQRKCLDFGNSIRRIMPLDRQVWSKLWMALDEAERHLLKESELLFLSLHAEVQSELSKTHGNIHGMFIQICEMLEISEELLDRKDLVKSLVDIFVYIITLSDEIRLANPQSPEFLEILQGYKRIADAFCNLNLERFHMYFFSSDEELQRFFERMDKKLQQSGKAALSNHDFSSIMSRFISPDIMAGCFFKPLPQSEDFLQLVISAIMHKYHSCVRESIDEHMFKKEVAGLLDELCTIFDWIVKYELFPSLQKKLNILCRLLPWDAFMDFLKKIKDLHPTEHLFICLTLKSIAKSIQKKEGMDLDYARILSNYPSAIVVDRAQIFKFVCGQLSITPGQEEEEEL